ncbi:MAG: hypothetical protein D6696_06155 [Acidobacteria bacterium]|nr:MAG: hypothetical protein D6696_06155 [Acidobacteriota bacterium]
MSKSTKKPSLRRAATLVRELSAAWKANPDLEPELGRPATAERIAETERRLGVELPRALVHLYSAHDGTGYGSIDGYHRLLSLDELVQAKAALDDLQSSGHFDHWRAGEWWNLAWVPFLDFEGNHLCVDTSTEEIVEFLTHDGKRTRLYPSAHVWLAALAEVTALARRADNPEDVMRSSRTAARVRKKLAPGYPVYRRARKRPKTRAPKGLEVHYQAFERDAYHWTIMRAGAFVQTYYGRAYSAQLSRKPFATEAQAEAFVLKAIKAKLKAGYSPKAPMRTTREDVHGILEPAARHMKSLPAPR